MIRTCHVEVLSYLHRLLLDLVQLFPKNKKEETSSTDAQKTLPSFFHPQNLMNSSLFSLTLIKDCPDLPETQ